MKPTRFCLALAAIHVPTVSHAQPTPSRLREAVNANVRQAFTEMEYSSVRNVQPMRRQIQAAQKRQTVSASQVSWASVPLPAKSARQVNIASRPNSLASSRHVHAPRQPTQEAPEASLPMALATWPKTARGSSQPRTPSAFASRCWIWSEIALGSAVQICALNQTAARTWIQRWSCTTAQHPPAHQPIASTSQRYHGILPWASFLLAGTHPSPTRRQRAS